MPTISIFYGIQIMMYFYDYGKHNAPHIHAEYQDEEAEAVVPVIGDARHRLVTKDDLEIALSPLKTDLAVLKWMIGIQLQG